MATRNWTPEQQQAIDARGGSLLVSAAAGSGKTAVLAQRAIGHLTDPVNPVDADKLLIVTFSRAAATEMRQRISDGLRTLLEQDPTNLNLLRQQLLLESAHISTIHAFCLDLIKENFQDLSLSPDFRLGDEREVKLLQALALQKVVEQYYNEDTDGQFADLVELFSSSRDDLNVERTVITLYNFLRAHPFYEDWLAQKLALYDPSLPLSTSDWGKVLLDYALQAVECALALTDEALDLIQDDEPMRKAYLPAFLQDKGDLCHLYQIIQAGQWDAIVDVLSHFGFAPLGRLTQYPDETFKNRVQGLRKKVKTIIEKLRDKQFCQTESQHQEDMEYLRPLVQLLFSLTVDFGRQYDAIKQERKLCDFSDLEHLALQLLYVKEEPSGAYIPSPFATEVAGRFAEVFIDEYQDTNSTQEMIFKAVSRNGKNLFMVGDVKQCIYRFRQAMPEVFLEKKQHFPLFDGHDFPAKILLNRNFRSRAGVTGSINFFFALLMGKTIGGIDYNEEERLIPQAAYPASTSNTPEVVLDIIDATGYEGEEEKAVLEARQIAGRIRALLSGGQIITRKDGQDSPITPRDICILMRSPKTRVDAYLKVFAEEGIPLWADSQSGYLQTSEISAVVALLRVVDNPLLDVEMVKAMMSPLFAFTAEQIAKLRLIDRHKSIYLLLGQAAQTGDSDVQHFLSILDELRHLAAVLPVDALLQKLYDLTAFPLVVRTMEWGEARLANLQLLLHYARDCESWGYRGLCGFVRFLDQLERQGEDLPPALWQATDAVALMSVHRSKGLEFPVVFLADASHGFNKTDLRSRTLVNSRLGFGCMRRDWERLIQFTTMPLEAVRIECENEMLSEELRILYVALTRAREQLFISIYEDKLATKLAGWASPVLADGKLPAWMMRFANAIGDWILMAALHHPDGGALRTLAGMEECGICAAPDRMSIQVVPPIEKVEPSATTSVPAQAEADPQLVAQIIHKATFQYPYEAELGVPSKLSVSDIVSAAGGDYRFQRRPDFERNKGLTPAEKGIALHKFMQFAVYAQAKQNPSGELSRLQAQHFLSADEADAIAGEIWRIEQFFASPLAERIFAADVVHRELRFLWEAGEGILGAYTNAVRGGATTVLQGVVDCLFIEKGRGVVVDYKTDHASSEAALAEHYRPQLLLYRDVMSQYLHIPIEECILYSFQMGKAISIV